jgi:hypothetical protein
MQPQVASVTLAAQVCSCLPRQRHCGGKSALDIELYTDPTHLKPLLILLIEHLPNLQFVSERIGSTPLDPGAGRLLKPRLRPHPIQPIGCNGHMLPVTP